MSFLVRLLQIELELAYIAFNEVTSPDKTSDLLFILVYIYLQAFIARELCLMVLPTWVLLPLWRLAWLWESTMLCMVKLVNVCFWCIHHGDNYTREKAKCRMMLLVSLAMGSSGESTEEDLPFHCWPARGSCVAARVKLQSDFGQNFLSKYFPAIFFWANTDLISQWTHILQTVTVHLGADSAWLGSRFWGWGWLFVGCEGICGVRGCWLVWFSVCPTPPTWINV